MSTTRSGARPQQRRPHSAAVYRRRRLMVGFTVLLLVVAIVNMVRGDDGGGARTTATQVAAEPTQTPSADVSADPTDGPTSGNGNGRKKRKKQQSAEPTQPAEPVFTPPPPPAEPDGPCVDSDILVEPVIGEVIAGRPVLVTLELRTQESEACTWTVDRTHLAYKITTPDGAGIWSSADCPGQVPSDTIVVRREQTSSYRLAWAGRESSQDCPTQGHVEPGDYVVQAAAIGGEPSAMVPFTLIDPSDVVSSDEPAGPEAPETTKPGKNKNKGKNKNRQTDAAGAEQPTSD